MTIIESQGGGSSASYKEPVVYGDIEEITQEFACVASLEKNERLYQNFKADGAIAGKYGDPDKVAWVWAFGRRWVQAYNRNSNGDSTENACKRIGKISDKVLKLLERPFSTKFDFYNNLDRRIVQFNQLYVQMAFCVEEEKGLNTLNETIGSCEVNATLRCDDTTSDKLEAIQQTIEKIKTVTGELCKTTLKLQAIQDELSVAGKPPKEHLEEVLEMILNPIQKFDIDAVNISHRQTYNAAVVKEVLAESFGEAVVNDMLRIYKLHDCLVVDSDDFYALTIGIVSNLTFKDVNSIVESKQGLAYKKILESLGEIDLSSAPAAGVSDVKSVEERLFEILNVLRSVDTSSSIDTEKPYAQQFGGDISSIISCNIVSEYCSHTSNHRHSCKVQKLKENFGYIEHLARDHTYSRFDHAEYKFRDGVIFPQYDDQGNKVCRQAHNVFNKDFIFALGVSPIPGVSLEEHKVQIVFRGTADLGSVKRDIQLLSYYGGPGGPEFAENADALIASAEAFVESREMDGVKLEILGHSLGATDAMRFGKLWAEHAANPKNADKLVYQQVGTVNLVTFNGPGYNGSYRDTFYQSVSNLPNVTFNVVLFTTHRDKVHKYGTYYAGQMPADIAKPANLNRLWAQFNFSGHLTSGDSLAEVVDNGSIASVGNAGYRKYTAHSHSYFKEHKRGTIDEMAPVRVRYFCTDKPEWKELIHEESLGEEVPAERIDAVLSTTFSYSGYLKTLPPDDE